MIDIAQLLKNNNLIISNIDKKPREYTKNDYSVGQTVYIRKIRGKNRNPILESKVAKVGRKYESPHWNISSKISIAKVC